MTGSRDSEMDYIDRAYDDAKYGRPSESPVFEITMPTSVDRTIAPQGKHILSMFVQYAPYDLVDGMKWDDVKESFADRCVAAMGDYAPNVPGAVEHRQVLSPLDLENMNPNRKKSPQQSNGLLRAVLFNQLVAEHETGSTSH